MPLEQLQSGAPRAAPPISTGLLHLSTCLSSSLSSFSFLAHAKAENYKPFLCYGVRGILSAVSVLFFVYLGFDAVLTMAEETKNPGQDIPIGLHGSMTICTVLYVHMALTLCLMVSTPEIDQNAPYSVAFQTVGMSWAKYVVTLGALKGITTVLLVGAVGQAQYLTHIVRTHSTLVQPCKQMNKNSCQCSSNHDTCKGNHCLLH